MKTRARGFSLIELLIVLLVIGAIIAVVTPLMLNAQAKAKATQVANNLKTIFMAFENRVYFDQTDMGIKYLVELVREAGDEYRIYFFKLNEFDYNTLIYYDGNIKFDFIENLLPDIKEADGINGLSLPSGFKGELITSDSTSLLETSFIPDTGVYYLQKFQLYVN